MSPADLSGRPAVGGALGGQSVFLAGGTGSFGQAFARYALDQGARRVAIFSRGEAKQAEMRAGFASHANADRLRFFVGDIRDATRVMDAARGADIVIHAAALKRVDSCEENPNEAVFTNVLGTLNVARACVERGVRKAVLLSTDKAASPNTLYGATKLTAERAWLAYNAYAAGTATRFCATRYGNVLGSTGSVVPIWRKQIANGENITVTDASCSRFWMSMPQAVSLVRLALERMRGGDLFIPKIGAANLMELARALSGDSLMVFEEQGLRPGEKLHETLISADEARSTYDCCDHYRIEPSERSWGNVPPLDFKLVPADYVLRSDTTYELSQRELREMLEAA